MRLLTAVVVEMHENTLVVLAVKHTVDHVADEQLQFQLASNVNILSYVLVRFCEHVPNHQAVWLFEIIETLCFRVEHLWLEFRYRNLTDVHSQ
jgi:hypothetical protein